MSSFVQKSLSTFGLDSSVPLAILREGYVEVPVQWSEHKWESGRRFAEIESPLRLLAGDPAKDSHSVLRAPFLAMLIGPSGVGKTELIRQLYCFSQLMRGENLEVLPISLAQNTWRDGAMRFPDQTPSLDLFRDFLFSANLTPETKPRREHSDLKGSLLGELVDKVILQDIHNGRVLLALDGLDEIITSRRQHDIFFERLFALMQWRDRSKTSQARIVISCRLEYLQSLKIEDSRDILTYAGSGLKSMPVHFLRLDFFSPSRITSYLDRHGRLELKKYLAQDPEHRSGLGDLMQRPLFLKLLCDLGDAAKADEATMQTTTDVMDRLVAKSANDAPGHWIWDNDRLAASSLELYKQRRSTFTREEILVFVAPRRPGSESEVDIENAFIAIHKCPFLRREEATVRFTHQVFFEYFVARGMWLGLKRSPPDRLSDFDRYVLTVEMRRFLRNRFAENEWRERTLRTYALEPERLHSWPDPAWARQHYDELEDVRYTLLDIMTGSVNLDRQLPTVFQSFLGFDQRLLHPRYLTYNYESLAVYLWEHRWSEADRKLESTFEDRLRKDIEASLRELSLTSTGRDDRERLVLRILDIGYRLRLPQILRFAQRARHSEAGARFGFGLIEAEDTRCEVNEILKDVGALDPKALRRQARG